MNCEKTNLNMFEQNSYSCSCSALIQYYFKVKLKVILLNELGKKSHQKYIQNQMAVLQPID